jgi:hypothetical protein
LAVVAIMVSVFFAAVPATPALASLPTLAEGDQLYALSSADDRVVAYSVDSFSGDSTQIASVTLDATDVVARSVDQDPLSGKSYVVISGAQAAVTHSWLYELDTTAGVFTLVAEIRTAGDVPKRPISVAVDGRGHAFFASQEVDSSLMSLDLTTGIATYVATLSHPYVNLAYNPSDEKVYAVDLVGGMELYTLDTTTGEMTDTNTAVPRTTFTTLQFDDNGLGWMLFSLGGPPHLGWFTLPDGGSETIGSLIDLSDYSNVQSVALLIERQMSYATAPVPTISGTTTVGSRLTAAEGSWLPAADSFSYVWSRMGTPIPGATEPTYDLGAADMGRYITVTVTAEKAGYRSVSLTSAETATVSGLPFTVTPTPTISGTPTVGQRLTVGTGSWTASPDRFTYEWKRAGTPIDGATRQWYVLTPDDVNEAISVTVTAIKARYETASSTSVATTAVDPAAFVTTTLPTITGTTTVGQTLTASEGDYWVPSVEGWEYIWKRGGSAIEGATAREYALQAADAGQIISLTLTAKAAGFISSVQTSAGTVAITPLEFVTTPTPTISGTLATGSLLTAHPGTWSPLEESFTYAWKRNGNPISGATDGTYLLRSADIGTAISVAVTAVKAGYRSTPTESIGTIPILRTFTTTTVPTISGASAVGVRLTAVKGTWSPSPTFTYVWKRDGVVIEGSVASGYRLVSADAGKKITVEVTGSRSGYLAVTEGSLETVAVTRPFVVTQVPTLEGTPQVGQTLTANEGVWTPFVEGFTYVWKRGDTVIEGAAGRVYVLQVADLGQVVTVTVTASTTGYTPSEQTSTGTTSISSADFVTTPTPTISGTLATGSLLTAHPGTWSPSEDSFTYVWKRAGTPISGASDATYLLQTADAGHVISVSVTAVKIGYTSTPTESIGTIPIRSIFTTTPLPIISGSVTVGQRLTVTTGSWLPAATFTYVWKRDGNVITGADGSGYRLLPGDAGAKITVDVTGSRAGYSSATTTSIETAAVDSIPFVTTPTPTITGDLVVGQTLKANRLVWSPSPDSATYQWLRNGVAISGAISKTYTLQAADGGTSISVTVGAIKVGYTTSTQTSAGTENIKKLFALTPTPTLSGSVTVGQRLTTVTGTWSPAPTFTYVWKRDGAVISGAAGSGYRLLSADIGKKISVEVTGSRSGYAPVAVTSVETTIVVR